MSSLLVEVVRVGDISKHPNADTLSMTTIKGWNCVVKDDQFKPGDLAIYVPIDAIMPDPLVEHYQLEYLKNGARVRTVKLRGVLSQGLLLTMHPKVQGFREGQDVADTLGITKWEPPAPSYQGAPNTAKATKNRPNPNFSRYCDPENIKNYPGVFQDGEEVCITEKIHGTNARFGNIKREWGKGWWARLKRLLFGWRLGEYEFAVGSRNVHLTGDNPQFYDGNVYHQIAKRYDLKNIIPAGYTLYGEIFGDKIQDLTYGLKDGKTDVVFFDLKEGDRYVPWSQCVAFCQSNGLPLVPVLYVGGYSSEALAKATDGKSILAPAQICEGCVVKTTTEVNDNRIGRKILKSVSAAYLLRKDGTEFH